MILETAVASLGVTSPALTAATSAANAESALSRSASGGRSHAMAALRRGGARRSMHSLIAVMSPDLARSITLRVIASASPHFPIVPEVYPNRVTYTSYILRYWRDFFAWGAQQNFSVL